MRDAALAGEGESLYWVHPYLTSETHHGCFPSRRGFILANTRTCGHCPYRRGATLGNTYHLDRLQ